MRLIQTYTLPLLFALVIHAGLGYALYQGWTPDTEVSSVITPKVVSAKLIILEPKARPKRQVTPKPMPTKPSVVKKPTPKKPDLANEAKAAAEKAAKVEKAEQKAKEARLEQQRLARLAALGELAQANLCLLYTSDAADE